MPWRQNFKWQKKRSYKNCIWNRSFRSYPWNRSGSFLKASPEIQNAGIRIKVWTFDEFLVCLLLVGHNYSINFNFKCCDLCDIRKSRISWDNLIAPFPDSDTCNRTSRVLTTFPMSIVLPWIHLILPSPDIKVKDPDIRKESPQSVSSFLASYVLFRKASHDML